MSSELTAPDKVPEHLPRVETDNEHREQLDPVSKSKQRPLWLNMTLFGGALSAGAVVYFAMPAEMPEAPRRMAALFAIAVVLWVTEAVPLFATSLMIIMGESWIIVRAVELGEDAQYTMVLNAFASPIIWIFLGGFILAKAVQREGLDVQMAALLLRPFGTRPVFVMAGFMAITAVFSMFMSNTATTAMMIVLVQPILAQLPEGERFRKGLVLSVPFAANIGGIGTPIGTPPNAIAIGQLEKVRGITISFAEWMAFALPLLFGALFVMWVTLILFYRPRTRHLHVALPKEFSLNRRAFTVYATFGLTVGLWLTGQWHGVPTAVVAVVPAALLTMTGLIGRREFNRLDWDILMLIAGGIALGTGITKTGLDAWIVQLLPGENVSFFALTAAFCVLAVIMSTVMSNSVAANLLIPIGLVAAATMPDLQAESLVVLIAIASSFAMGLPISTPPNAIAYSTNQIAGRDIMVIGGLCSVAATALIIVSGPPVIGFFIDVIK